MPNCSELLGWGFFFEQIAFYLAFLNMYSSWLIYPAVFGTGFYIYFWIDGDLNNDILLFYSILLSIWTTFLTEMWKRKQNELAYIWDVSNYQESEPIRFEYKGRYDIDSVSRKIIKQNAFTTFARRGIVRSFPF